MLKEIDSFCHSHIIRIALHTKHFLAHSAIKDLFHGAGSASLYNVF